MGTYTHQNCQRKDTWVWTIRIDQANYREVKPCEETTNNHILHGSKYYAVRPVGKCQKPLAFMVIK